MSWVKGKQMPCLGVRCLTGCKTGIRTCEKRDGGARQHSAAWRRPGPAGSPLGYMLPSGFVLPQAEVAGPLHTHLTKTTKENLKELTVGCCPLPLKGFSG